MSVAVTLWYVYQRMHTASNSPRGKGSLSFLFLSRKDMIKLRR